MSKEKPEVGDVWEHKASDRKVIIAHSCMMRSEKIMAYILFDGVGSYAVDKLVLLENYKYLGKSKVSIKELFDVAED